MPVVTWADSPATTTPLDAAELNAAFAGCLQADGTVTATAAIAVLQALGGAGKIFLHMDATDGKTYQLIINTNGSITLYNATDGVAIAAFGPAAGQMTLNGASVPTVGAHSTSAFTMSAGAGAPATLATGEIYFQLS